MNEDFKIEDFAYMMFGAIKVPLNRSILKAFPELLNLPEFALNSDTLDMDKLIRYVMFCYDRKSPLQRLELGRRKIKSAELAGLPINSHKEFSNVIQNVFNGQVREVNDMIIRFCRMQYPRKYTFLVSANEAFFNTMKELINYTPSDDDILKQTELKGKIFNQAKMMVRELDDMAAELFSSDKSEGLHERLFRSVEKEALKLSPEDYAL